MRITYPVLVIIVLFAGCQSAPTNDVATAQAERTKIQFSLDAIRTDGLRGPADGLTSVAYEFCVPTDDTIYAEVRAIDPSVKFYRSSPGRIGCQTEQTLCIGDTHQHDWNAKLLTLAALPYINEIRECHFE